MKRTGIALILITALLCALLSACKSQEELAAYRQPETTVISPDVTITQQQDEPDTLTVSGTGKVMLTPDTASFRLTIRTTEEEAMLTQESNAAITEAVMAALAASGIRETDIKTESISLYEEYDYSENEQKLIGYTMNNVLSVTVRSIDSVGKVISDAIAAGATGTHGLSFTVSDSSEGYCNALAAAIEDAALKAEAMAKALGVSLEAVPVSTVETSSSYTPYLYSDRNESVMEEAPMYSTGSSASSSVAVSEGELTVTARVSVIYAVAQDTAAE